MTGLPEVNTEPCMVYSGLRWSTELGRPLFNKSRTFPVTLTQPLPPWSNYQSALTVLQASSITHGADADADAVCADADAVCALILKDVIMLRLRCHLSTSTAPWLRTNHHSHHSRVTSGQLHRFL